MIEYATSPVARNIQRVAREERARAIKNAWAYLFAGNGGRIV